MIKPVIGKKVILFEIEPRDFKDFSELHRKDKHGYLQQFCLKKMSEDEAYHYVASKFAFGHVVGFSVMTKEGKAARRAGYVYICDMTERACTVSGVMDIEFAKGLGKLIRKDKYTYSEDALRTLVSWIFKNFPKVDRIETDVVSKNGRALALVKKVGFVKEGTLRRYIDIDGVSEDLVINSILREEHNNGIREEQKSVDNDSRVSEADSSIV